MFNLTSVLGTSLAMQGSFSKGYVILHVSYDWILDVVVVLVSLLA